MAVVVVCNRCLVIFLFLSILYRLNVHGQTVNVAQNRPISANITCGALGSENYISQRWISSPATVQQQNEYTCYNASTLPATNMVDGNYNTWWQSTSRRNIALFLQAGGPDITIYLDLQQVFEVQLILLQFGESVRPGRIVIYKGSTDFFTVIPWVYQVTNELNCIQLYNTPSVIVPTLVTSAMCKVYSNLPQSINELLTYDFTKVALANWRNTRFLKIEFYDMALVLGIGGFEFQHYTVRMLTVMAQCTCNGQQITCTQNNITGIFQCVCGGYTMGVNCEQCLPFYNQLQYQYAVPCTPCNCMGHSNVCFFDQNVANAGGSLNSAGVPSGGGVCQNCSGGTAGANCQLCASLMYRPLTQLQTNPNPCIPCNCTGPGIALTGLIGSCVMNSDVAPVGMSPGDCYCQPNVMGPQCTQCSPGAYMSNPNNPTGCLACGCNVNGTVGASILCNGTGFCNCKPYTTTSQCGICTNNYWGLNGANPNGCSACMCDVGGALSPICTQSTGNCVCRSGVTSQQCTSVVPNDYIPDPQFINGEFESLSAPFQTAQTGYFGFGYVTAVPQIPQSASVTPPIISTLSGEYQIVVHYSTPTALSGVMSVAGLSQVTLYVINVTFPACSPPQWCYAALGVLSLPPGVPSTISLTQEGTSFQQLLLDRIAAVPVEYLNATNLFGQQDNTNFQSTCNVISNGILSAGSNTPYCMSRVFSVGTYYLEGALPCSCNYFGSVNSTCNPYGGQCTCKPGVTGRMCDTCQLQYYSLTSLGCQACNCSSYAFKACNQITGQCLCPPGIQGLQCDQCMPNYYNFNYNQGCTPCGCNQMGSTSLACNVTNGMCSCKTGVTGAECNQCLSGYYQLSYSGCLQCTCDPGGAVNNICNQGTGQCQCKKNVKNQQCTSCTFQSFSKTAYHVDGCLLCICMAITSVCTGAVSFLQQTTSVNLFVPVGSTLSPIINIATNTLVQQPAGQVTMTIVSGVQMAQVQATGTQTNLYWVVPTLAGDLLQFYGSTLSFIVNWIPNGPSGGAPYVGQVLLIGLNNAQFSFSFSNATVPSNVLVSVNVIISLENVIASGQPTATRGQLLLAMTSVQAVLIPITYYNQPHTSRIGQLTYTQYPTEVEQCYCPLGYDGLSCENCSAGFMRTNVATQGYLGNCAPCNCNSHSQLCNPSTGQCINCLDFTAGNNCEQCASGYYRPPSSPLSVPCIPCPCYVPRSTNESCVVNNGTVMCTSCNTGYVGNQCSSCDNFYYGYPQILFMGTCSRCNCNNNSNACNAVTGQCSNCTANTTGSNCQQCMDGWYGNATLQNCALCGCNVNGSTSPICNNQTGQCPCISGVGNRACDGCLPDYYRSTTPGFLGCYPCNCNTAGSSSLTCSVSGQCPCNTNTVGLKCDQCQPSYWGLPTQTCQTCNCNSTGTNVTAFVPTCDTLTTTCGLLCDIHSGQCICNPYITGRQCDSCIPLYTNFSISGCVGCGLCETSLGNDTIALLNQFQFYWNQTTMFQQIQAQDAVLLGLQLAINNTWNMTNLQNGNNLIITLNSLINSLLASQAAIPANLTVLTQKILAQEAVASQILNSSVVNLGNVLIVKSFADAIRLSVGTQLISVQNNIQTLQTYNASAYALLQAQQSQPPVGTIFNWNGLFEPQRQQALIGLGQATSILAAVQQYALTIATQVNTTIGLQAQMQQLTNSFNNWNNLIAAINSNVMSLTANVIQQKLQLNATMANLLTAQNIWNSVQATMAQTNNIINGSEWNLTSANQLIRDCQTIINGVPSGGTLPIDTNVNLAGIIGWNQTYTQISQQLPKVSAAVTNFTVSVAQAEQQAGQLWQQAQSILNAFQSVQGVGQPAVNAINNFQNVITTLNQSQQLALAASTTMQQALNQLQIVSVQSLEASANQSLSASESILLSVNAYIAGVSAPALIGQLEAANSSLQTAIQEWNDINSRLLTFQTSLQILQNTASNFSISSSLSSVNAAGDAAIQTAGNVAAQDAALQVTLSSQATTVANLVSSANNLTSTEHQLQANSVAFRNQLTNVVEVALLSINATEAQVLVEEPPLTVQLNTITSQLNAIVATMGALEQPVFFNGQNSYEQLPNPDNGLGHPYDSVGLDFNPSVLIGVLLFIENSATNEKILIQIVNSSVVFEYSLVDVKNTAVSPAILQTGTWYRVYATRYQYDGQLTVIKMSTGGAAVTTMRTINTFNVQLNVSSPIFVAGLALSVENQPKVYNNGIPFFGCIYRVIYQDVVLPLWQSILRVDDTATCCKKPPAIPGPATITPCITFYGFGFISFSYRPLLSLLTQASISFEFRTFEPNGVLFVISAPTTADYYVIYLNVGLVTLGISTFGNVVVVSTANTYNNGQWYQLTATHSLTTAQLTLTPTIASAISPEIVSQSNQNINFGSLNGLGFTFGGQNPAVSVGPVLTSFAGSIQLFQHSLAGSTSLSLQPDSLTTGITASANVNLNSCLASVINGLGFRNTSSYAHILSISSPIVTLSFQLMTTSPSGVIFYAQLSQGALTYNLFLYIAIYNGDVFMLFNQGQGIQPAFRTRGLFLCDGLQHTISFNFGFTNSPRLTVDTSEAHVGNVAMTPNFYLIDSSVYVGGVPTALGIDSTMCPVRISLVGGISNLQINNGLISFFNPTFLSGANVQGIDLSGLPTPPTVLPPLPYSTVLPPTTATPPTCIKPSPYTYLNNTYLSFSGGLDSYVIYNIEADETLITSVFSLRFSFRALQANGILAYMASTSSTAPSTYFCIYMYEGYIRTAMITNTLNPATRNLQSQYTYVDGLWHELEVLRVNDFLAIIVSDKQDYINDFLSTTISSEMTITTNLYVGGVPSSLLSFGFPFDASDIAVGVKSFQGCITNVTLTQYNLQLLSLGPIQEIVRESVTACPTNVTVGLSFTVSIGYARVADSVNGAPTFNLVVGFVLTITFRSTSQSGTLMVAWSSSTHFVALALSGGEVQIIMGSSTSSMFAVTSTAMPTQVSVCNDQPHTITFTINPQSVTLQTDSYPLETFPFAGFQFTAPLTVPIYVGGIKDPSWTVPNFFSSTTTFQGCIQNVVINGIPYYITESNDVQGAVSGCPV